MKKWQNLAPPDDENSWYDVNGFWPLTQSYETVEYLDTGTSAAAAAASDVSYAWCANTLSSRREYVVDTAKIWEYSGGAYTDRTGGVAIGTNPYMMQYGDVTICAMGNATATAKSTGGNFSALAGAPQAEIVLPVANAVLYLNTNTSADGWAASDVGDYTNYATGEAASGRLIQSPGPITAGVSFGNYAIVFKGDAIYRLTYVGGVIKWTSELLFRGVGCKAGTESSKYTACSGGGLILFPSYVDGLGNHYWYIFDGASQPRRVNPLTTVSDGRVIYNPQKNIFTVCATDPSQSFSGTILYGRKLFFYNAVSDAWGRYQPSLTVGTGRRDSDKPLMGDFSARGDSNDAEKSSMPVMYGQNLLSANTLFRYKPGGFSATYTGTCSVQSWLQGAPEQKLLVIRLLPQYLRRSNGASAAVSLSAAFYPECFNTRLSARGPTASQTVSKTESSAPYRFDFTASDSYVDFTITWVDVFVEFADILPVMQPAGKK